MLLRRIRRELGEQNWTSVAIEFVIVVVGVFLGTQVSNWNQDRIEQRQTLQMLAQVRPTLHHALALYANARQYYGLTRRYAGTAFAGWAHDPRVSDEQFVIAAYQATQILGFGMSNDTLAMIFGADQIRNVPDVALRDDLSRLLAYDNRVMSLESVAMPYRTSVRTIIPTDVQEALRLKCGDKDIPGTDLFIIPPTCALRLPPAQAAAVAAALRARPDLVGQLNVQLSAEAVFLENIRGIEEQTQRLSRKLDRIAD